MNLIAFWTAFGIALGLARPMLAWLTKIKSRQTISQYVPEHAQKQGTPTMGGLMFVIPLALYLGWTEGVLSPWLGAILAFAAIGFVDDFVLPRVKAGSRGLGWMPKLLLQVGAAWWLGQAVVAGQGWGAQAGFIFWVLALANAYNFADGLDGLAGGLFLILAVGWTAFAAIAGVAVPHVMLAGAALMLPFLSLNAPPARVFMGDVGSMALGALLAVSCWDVLSAATAAHPAASVTIITAGACLLFVLGAELIPVPLQIAAVKLIKRRIFPRTPIHHAFQAAGWPETRIVAFFFIVQVAAVMVGLSALVPRLGGGT